MKMNNQKIYRVINASCLMFALLLLLLSGNQIWAQEQMQDEPRRGGGEQAEDPYTRVKLTSDDITAYMKNFDRYIEGASGKASANPTIPGKVAAAVEAQQGGILRSLKPPKDMARTEIRYGLSKAGSPTSSGQEVYYIVVPVDEEGNILENRNRNPYYLGVQVEFREGHRGTGDCPPFCD